MSNAAMIIAELAEILEEDFYALKNDGDSVETDVGLFETVKVIEGVSRRWVRRNSVITKTPDNRYFRWSYDQGLTESQDSMGPAEIDINVKLVEVTPEEVIVVNIIWKEV